MVAPSDFKHYQLKVNGINMHYVMEGNGPQTILVCHGWPDIWFGWRHLIKPLAAAGYRVIAPDMKGYGDTDAPTNVEAYGHKAVSDDLVALLDHYNIQKVILLGHDWGGEVVWRMCLYYPNRVLAVGSVCTAYVPRSPKFFSIEDVVKRAPAFAYQAYLAGPKAAKDLEANTGAFFNNLYRKSSDETSGLLMRTDGSFIIENDLPKTTLLSRQEFNYYVQQYQKRGFQGCLNWYRTRRVNWESEANLPVTISHPALIITAGKDFVLTPQLTAKMESYIPNLKRGHVEEAGHWVLMEKPDEVLSIIKDWLKSLPSEKSKI